MTETTKHIKKIKPLKATATDASGSSTVTDGCIPSR